MCGFLFLFVGIYIVIVSLVLFFVDGRYVMFDFFDFMSFVCDVFDFLKLGIFFKDIILLFVLGLVF